MTKFYSVLASGLLAILTLGALPAAGQTQPITKRTCGTEEINAQIQAELKRTLPGYDPARSTAAARPLTTGRTAAITYTLPVIVHVISNGEAVGTGSNISQAQIQSQLDVLNEDYRNLNADGAQVPTVYQPRRGDMQVQFVNALRDPNGTTLAEPGIDRVDRNAKGWAVPPYTQSYINSTIKPGTYWDPSRYINIWVMNLSNGLLGYAQFPDNTAGLGGLSPLGGSAATDGVVVLYAAFGSRAKAPGGTYATPYDLGRTLTHELGHWFGFRHVWGDITCGDDYCPDTPTQQAENYGCVAFPHVTCTNGTGDMSMNYMDYSDDRCMYMFTQGQKDRLQAVMAAGTPRRSELLNSNVLCAGTTPATAASSGPVCAGSTLTLTATGPAGATYAWTGPNGFTSTTQNPTLTNVTAAAAGTYRVIVTVGTGTCPGFATAAVVVNPAPGVPILAPAATCVNSPITLVPTGLTPTGTLPNENFNGTAPGWTIANSGAPTTAWQYTTGSTYTYIGGFSLQNFSLDGTPFAVANSDVGGQNSLTNTTLTSPVFSTVGYSALRVSFQQLYVPEAGTGAVEISTDGGTTWTAAATYTSQQYATTTPSVVDLAAYLNQPTVRLRFHYTDNYGYLWAIDNVQFTATAPTLTYTWTLVSGNGFPTVTNTPTLTVTPTQNSVYRLTVGFVGSSCTSSATVNVAAVTNNIQAYPVPFGDDGLSLQVSTCTAGSLDVQIFDVIGRRVYGSTLGNVAVGIVTVSLPETGRLRPGKYIVKVQQGGQNSTFNVVRQ